jgi:lipoprotein-releasing system ATP-binding protein
MNKNILEFKGVCKHYMQAGNKIKILTDASFSVQQGEIAAIIGESGSGKSTLLHIAGLLDSANSGKIILLDKNVSEIGENSKNDFRLNNLGFIYQYHHLLPDFTALENILMPQLIMRAEKQSALTKAMNLMEKLNISDKAKNLPGELSGGQQQRVAIARAMINNPQIIFADEPTGNLDSANAREVFNLLKIISMEQKTTVVIVTHSQELASKADKIFELKQKQIQQIK